MKFCLYMCVLINVYLCFEQFYYTSVFRVINVKNRFSKRKNGFESSFFYKMDVSVVTNFSVRLENHKKLEILLMVDFLRILKNVAFFEIVRDF